MTSVLRSFSLADRTAVVTGGAGLFGRQITEALAEAGARVFIASRNVDALESHALQLRARELDVTALPLDQSCEESVLALRDQVLSRSEQIDVLVNNAVQRPMRGCDSPAADFAASMEVNGTGLFLMIRAFGRAMARSGSGSIINIASIQGLVGPDLSLYEGLDWTSPPDYFFHKGGMLQLTKYAAALLGPRGVRVNAISPGGLSNGQDPRFVARYNARTFLNRMANESDLKGAVVFLASDASNYVTGANIPIDGGYTAK